jgi:hypothetical protein
MTSRIRRLATLAAVGAALALTVTFAMDAHAAHDDCTVTVNPPALDYGIFVSAYALVNCATVKNTIRQSHVLTMDGVEVDRVDHTWHKRAEGFSFVLVNDVPGGQVWCVHFSVRIGPHSLGTTTRCETETF